MNQLKFLDLVKARKEKRLKEGNGEPIELGAPINFPVQTERDYEKRLLRYVEAMDKAVKERVLSRLEPILRQARLENARFDNYVDDLESTFNGMRVQYGEEIDPTQINREASTIAENTNNANAAEFTGKIRAVTGLDVIASNPAIRNAVKLWVQKNVTLIKTLGEEHFKDIERIVTDGVESGKSLRTISKEITEKTGATRARARLIARDQVGRLTSSLTTRRATDLGVKRFRWITSVDDRVRASHRALHRKIFSFEKGASVDGQDGVLPGEPINCRCAINLVLSSIGEDAAETNKRVATQSEIDEDIEKEKARQKQIDKRRQAKLAEAREAQRNR